MQYVQSLTHIAYTCPRTYPHPQEPRTENSGWPTCIGTPVGHQRTSLVACLYIYGERDKESETGSEGVSESVIASDIMRVREKLSLIHI